ncbi:hypothetical protein DESC_920012 [Desulfosarcina cetonica]|nr:hypothetical protein DESC_920012 [Desulfosarcina cetonica]
MVLGGECKLKNDRLVKGEAYAILKAIGGH